MNYPVQCGCLSLSLKIKDYQFHKALKVWPLKVTFWYFSFDGSISSLWWPPGAVDGFNSYCRIHHLQTVSRDDTYIFIAASVPFFVYIIYLIFNFHTMVAHIWLLIDHDRFLYVNIYNMLMLWWLPWLI